MLRLTHLSRGLLLAATLAFGSHASAAGMVVLQTDFGLKDQAVAAMRGVIRIVDRSLTIDDLTHEIPAYNVWEAAYRLNAVIDYWPKDAVFVSVVDPGVGTSRTSVVAHLKNGQMIVTPDNGTLTLAVKRVGVIGVRQIDERRHRLPGSETSYTFHGRDLYAYVGALLASGRLKFDDVGPLQTDIVKIRYEQAGHSDGRVFGGIPVLDPQFGNVWTNIPSAMLDSLNLHVGDSVHLMITDAGTARVDMTLPYVHTFGDVPVGEPLLYINSIGMVALALNQKSFAAAHGVASGPAWRVEFTPIKTTRTH